MSAVNGFMILLMTLLLAYTFYRLIRKKSILMVIPACCQVFPISIAIPAFRNDVEVLPILEWTYLIMGVALPATFLVYDYFKMIGKVRERGVYTGFVEAPPKTEPDTRCLPSEGINPLARDRQASEILKELQNLPEDILKNMKKSINHANSLAAEGKYPEAYIVYDTMCRIAATSQALYYNMAGICYRMGRYAIALEDYKKALELAGKDSDLTRDLHHNLGNTCYMLKKYEKAAKYFEEVIGVDPENIPVRENLAFSYVRMGEKEKGIQLLNTLKSGEDGYRAHFISGMLLSEAGRYDEAEGELKSCIRLQPASLEARGELGKVLLRQNKPEEALEQYDEILKLNQDDYSVWCNRANLCSRLKHWSEAVVSYGNAIRLKPDNSRNYYNMGVALEECGKREPAIEAYQNAIRINPSFTDAYNNLGIALSMEGRNEEALEVYEEGIRTNPGDFSLFFNMGMNLFESGRYIEAAAAYRNALDIRPEELEVYYCLGAALTELRHYNDAIEAYKCALKMKPSDGELHYNIAAIYAMLGRYDIAGENLRQAIVLKDDVKADAMRNKAFDGMRGRREFKELVS